MKKIYTRIFGIFLLGITLPCQLQVWASGDEISPLTVLASKDRSILFIAEKSKKRIVFFDIAQSRITRTIPLPAEPNGLAISPDGSRLYVTTESPGGDVFVIHTEKAFVEALFHAGHTPCAPILSPDGGRLYVCNEFNNNISILDTRSGKELEKLPAIREPVASALTPDGKCLLVANLLPNGASTGDTVAAVISLTHLDDKKTITLSLPDGSSSVRGICISPDGRFAYAVHDIGHYQLPTTRIENGWMNTAALSIIDVKTEQLLNTIDLDDANLGAANPWCIACNQDGRFLCITHAGTHELSVIDRPSLHEKLEHPAHGHQQGIAPQYITDDFSFLKDMRRRIHLAGNGPRGFVLIGSKAYIAEYFSDSLGIVDIQGSVPALSVSLGETMPMSPERRGEMLFHDATRCKQHWQSCSSCHPGGRMDGLNWDLLNDGIGNPKNTRSLLYAHKASPLMWLGARESLGQAVQAGFHFIEFADVSGNDVTAVEAYLKSLQPVPSPYLTGGIPGQAAERGKIIFNQHGCAECHIPPVFACGGVRNIGTGSGLDRNRSFTVPTLVETWRTAPYLHDGRASTLRDIFTGFNKSDLHGSTSSLTKEELDDLIQYVLSL